MLVLEQRLSARHLGRGVVLRARLIHGVEARGWRMKFSLLKAEVEIEADPDTYKELARRLKAANVHVRPARLYSRLALAPKSVTSPMVVNKPTLQQPAILATTNQMKPLYCQDGGDVKVSTPPCHSPDTILPDLPQPAEDPDKSGGLSKEASSAETQAWLSRHRFSQHAPTFANFSGADLLRLSRDDIIQICGLADGIRLFNALHANVLIMKTTYQSILPFRLDIFCDILPISAACLSKDGDTVLVLGPNGARVRLTDDLVRHMPDHSTYRLQRLDDGTLLLSATDN
ncbi:Transcription factor CP2-like protein 1 [Papilio xuthus]|uniref:Transcription factor CP2-like protein 1 n=1 Tax=Papilio xuthus TaxID=66420 RepID=A0A194PTH5_PAPXU|nr:Transcription factor CP2-like protein 1 [Papilio xuthus]